jgi:predicted PhzF superfamily epimerase YddE/YHI9
MKIPIWQVDAFAGRVFGGNPAAVCLLESWLDDGLLQSIAAENNLSETAFLVGGSGRYRIRWFTPRREVDLCGHATLASGSVVFDQLEPGRLNVVFDSKSGPLTVVREGELLALDFPARPAEPIDPPPELMAGLGGRPREVLAASDYLAVYGSEEEVRGLCPDLEALEELDRRGVIVTAPGHDVDFVSRFFAPAFGIPEDPVTGSAHCTLIPYWSKRLGKKSLHALQVSERVGELYCEDRGERVKIAGRVALYLEGSVFVS